VVAYHAIPAPRSPLLPKEGWGGWLPIKFYNLNAQNPRYSAELSGVQGLGDGRG